MSSSSNPSACCIPSNKRLKELHRSIVRSLDRLKAPLGTQTSDLVGIPGGIFRMGSDRPDAFPTDGEGPSRLVTLHGFWISRYAVTNEQFALFAKTTGYKTTAERLGSSFVFEGLLGTVELPAAAGAPWWRLVNGACWNHPEGPDSEIRSRLDHPVVHVTWEDAVEYCNWFGARLPTEAEWEYASRGCLDNADYPWGQQLSPGGIHMCNKWQGDFPSRDLGEDGFVGTAPADSFAPNGYGLHNTAGNVWEWCQDWFDAAWHQTATTLNPVGPETGQARVTKGGSYLCHESYCQRYRNGARTGTAPDTSSGHIGFRVAADVAAY